jgi:hypothetical protein
LFQNAQVEKGLVATDYIETGASTAQAGILEDLPRLDYSGGASCPALLLEPQRTNLFTQSEYFNSTDWAKTNVTATDNSNVSPDGLQNATLINDGTAASTQHWFYQPIPVSSGNTYTISFYAKYVDRKNMFINIYDGSTSNFVFYDIQNGVVLNNDGNAVRDIVDVGNGWYRIIYTRAVVGSGANFRIGMANDAPIQTYTGENKQALVYGFQLETGSYPTSYIPTMGSAVTRSREVSSLTGFDFFSNGEGTALIEFEINETTILSYPELFRIFNPSDATNFLYCYIFEQPAGDVKIGYRLDVNNSKKIEAAASIALGTNKIVVRLQRGAYTAYLNGTEIAPSQEYNDVADVNMTTLRIYAQTYIANERIKQFLTFPTPLTDSECIALTTI